MYHENVVVPCELTGRMIHALVYFAQSLSSSIYYSTNGRTINAKSMIGVISLDIHKGDSLQISVVNSIDKEIADDSKRIIEYIERLGDK